MCGLWHGISWNYLLWGLLWGIGQSISFILLKQRKKKQSKKSIILKITNIILVFLFVAFSWIIFRSNNMETVFSVLKDILTKHGGLFIGDKSQFIYSLLSVIILLILEIYLEIKNKYDAPFAYGHWIKRQLGYALLIIMILLIGVFDGGQFIYFQF